MVLLNAATCRASPMLYLNDRDTILATPLRSLVLSLCTSCKMEWSFENHKYDHVCLSLCP